MEFFLTRLSSSIAQINEAQVLKISAARDLVLMLYSYNKETKFEGHQTNKLPVEHKQSLITGKFS